MRGGLIRLLLVIFGAVLLKGVVLMSAMDKGKVGKGNEWLRC